MKKTEYIEKYGEDAYKKLSEKKKQYYQQHKEKIKEGARRRREEHPEYMSEWRQKNKDKINEYNKIYSEEHREEILNRQRNYNKEHQEDRTNWWKNHPMKYRATYLSNAYKQKDKKTGMGESTLTSKWILENIFTKTCYYCGESDWKLLGCDRIDNSKPHTPDNVVCSCWDCNNERRRMSFEEFSKLKGVV